MANRRKKSSGSSLLSLMINWYGCAIGLAAVIFLALNPLTTDGKPSVSASILVGLLFVGGIFYLLKLFKGKLIGPSSKLEGPLLLTAGAWTIFRVGAMSIPHLLFLPAASLAWISIRSSLWVKIFCWVAAIGIEVGLVASGGQPLFLAIANLSVCLATTLALLFFPGSTLYRHHLEKSSKEEHKERSTRQQVKELGLDANGPSLPEFLDNNDNQESFSHQAVDNINISFELQLEMLRQSLDLNTVAVLWPSPDGNELRLRYLATSRPDIDQGPYPAGTGITGALTDDRHEAELVPVKPTHPALPYYKKQEGAGAAMALKITSTRDNGSEQAITGRPGILCVDRQLSEPWSEQEKQVLRHAANKMAIEVEASRMLLNMDRERSSTRRLYLGLRELNSGLNLESVFAASISAVKTQAPVDLVAVSLLSGDNHKVAMIDGLYSSDLSETEYPVTEGLVGQSIRTGKVLPVGGRYRSAAPIFSKEKSFSELNSLLIIPLRNKSDEPMGALTVAARKEGIFNRYRQEVLELIAAQVAIKIELAQAHEQLSQLATTDGLTGLANHRTFQHGFDMMLARSERSDTPLCLIMCDLDHFKSINDTYGHPFGDDVLQKVSAILTNAVRSVDMAARYGGEEFAMILENCDTEGGFQLAERVREQVESLALWHDDRPVSITISLGVAISPLDASEKSVLIDRADQALYHAKRNGRNTTVVYSEVGTGGE